MNFKIKLLSSLNKVFAESGEPAIEDFNKGRALAGEVYAFQLAYFSKTRINNIEWELESPLKEHITLRQVGLVPAEYLSPDVDETMLTMVPGLFPDPLLPCPDKLKTFPQQWRSLWITVSVPETCKAGKYPIKIKFTMKKEELDCKGKLESDDVNEYEIYFELEVLPASLPKQALKHSEWFHADCIAVQYNVAVWSEKHWRLLRKYFKNMAEHDINQILTPIFTLALDTAVNHERPTTQLVDIFYDEGKYCFDFSRLERWIVMAGDAGIKNIEISHLFSQWGAKKTPKIIVCADGVDTRKFGWHTEALSEEYIQFLNVFLPALINYLQSKNFWDNCCFHISDEPHLKDLEHFSKVAELVKKYIPAAKIIDAISNIEYYEKRICENPIPAISELAPFINSGIKNLWTYYCCGPWENSPNRYFNMPLARTRALGLILYKYNLSGFLHWGYNFWFKRYSTASVDPFRETDAGGEFPAGDAFLVYPGNDGPLDSIRYEVLREGFQDHQVLKLLENLTGRMETIEFIEKLLGYEISDTHFPKKEDDFLKFRNALNDKIFSLLL